MDVSGCEIRVWLYGSMSGQRSARLSMLALIQEGILEPGEGLLTFDYMVLLTIVT